MRIEIHINCDNAAFAASICTETARILRSLAVQVEDGFAFPEMTLLDVNGRACGSFRQFERDTRKTRA
jgi:hypothetical protein